MDDDDDILLELDSWMRLRVDTNYKGLIYPTLNLLFWDVYWPHIIFFSIRFLNIMKFSCLKNFSKWRHKRVKFKCYVETKLKTLEACEGAPFYLSTFRLRLFSLVSWQEQSKVKKETLNKIYFNFLFKTNPYCFSFCV